ncbi:PCMD domain-containing protein [Sediminitomix flava]|uniref:Putative glycosyl hydrolase or carbohydrate binding protein n=1 Tax=Sediminitomix flava TaxID=379075 RepID=A0A315Z6G8_SEDFL|nr:PCMD domain-containing protein [Sediminitomix flava]PWJ38570.1 putative glycosyl hydrolase or carbohydrate binding protein [Sediminitomix flava]
MKINNTTYILYCLLFVLASCIEDDTDYPIINGEFLSFSVEGQTKPAVIDLETRTVTVEVEDEVELSSVKILEYSITEDASIQPEMVEIDDFSEAKNYVISTYQDYDWTIEVRYGKAFVTAIEIENQVGEPLIDNHAQNITLFVEEGSSDLEDIRLTTFEVSEGATASPNPMELTNFSEPVEITIVSAYGEESVWHIEVKYEPVLKSFTIENALNDSIYVSHNIIEVTMPVGTDLSKLTVSDFELQEGATASPDLGTISDLSTPQTVKITSAQGNTQDWIIRAQEARQVEFSMFDDWFSTDVKNLFGNVKGQYYLPGNDESSVWGSGDIGAAMNTVAANTISALEDNGTTYAHLESKSVLGVLAAGSLFTGTMEADGLIPKTNFGMPFTERPLSFELDYRAEMLEKDGYQDGYDIYILLQVREGEGDNEKRYRLGTAWYRSTESVDDWTHLKIPVEYGELISDFPKYMEPNPDNEFSPEEGYWDDPTAVPTHAIVVFSSSYDGDNMNGVVGSSLEINNVTLEYK